MVSGNKPVDTTKKMCKKLIPIYLNFLREGFPGIVPHKTCMEFLANSKIVDICVKGRKKYTSNRKHAKDAQETSLTWHFRFPGQLTPHCTTSLNIN